MVIRAGLLGHPVSHSLSPRIHARWLENRGIEGNYVAKDAGGDKASFAATLAGVRGDGWAGCNVTLPFKAEALRLADEADGAARAIGTANTLVFERSLLRASNTDTIGFAAALARHGGQGGRALILGAGGTAPAVLWALREGWDCVVANRTRATAEALAERFGAGVAAWEDREMAARGADLLVNATALGLPGRPALDLDLSVVPDHALVADCVYAPSETDLVHRARARGLRAYDGVWMLAYQARPGFQDWFGGPPVTEAEVEAVVAELQS